MDKKEFMRLLSSADIDTEIAQEVVSRMEETGIENNIIFIFTEEDYVVTAIHVPAESINGEDGPVLMRGAGDKSIIAAFSRELIMRKLDIVEESPPGLPLIADQAWVDELEKMAQEVKIQMQSNPPERWEDLLKGNG
jgi:hypothetical protein